MFSWKGLFTPTVFNGLISQYYKETSYGLALISNSRIEFDGCSYYPWAEAHQRNIDLGQMVRESLRWGEPAILLDNRDIYVWTIPVSINNITIGGIFSASHAKDRIGERETQVGAAARLLMDMACRENFCNSSLMKINSEKSRSSARHAEIIHTSKNYPHQHPREIYLRDEFELLNAIKKRDREKAREIINRILVGVYNVGRNDFDILKTLVLEMVVLMYRAGVERGADPHKLLGVNSTYLKDLHEVTDEVALSGWLTNWLEDFINTSFHSGFISPPPAIALALEHMKNNLGGDLTRDSVAHYCNMSSAYFSRVFKEKTGHTFSDQLNRFRIEQACFLLDDNSLNVNEVTFRAGFNDQSYFNKIFKKYRKITPGAYRRQRMGTQHKANAPNIESQ
ncbi:MAG: helix-turn-helix domain-containing protein [Spirochaeta sp.]|nr:helix-turn-helix domain-containing protein [Spirochaeta sp.]